MSWTRWKVLAGFLTVAIGGLAAFADPQCPGNAAMSSRQGKHVVNYQSPANDKEMVTPVVLTPPPVAMAKPLTLPALPKLLEYEVPQLAPPSVTVVPVLPLSPEPALALPKLEVAQAPRPELPPELTLTPPKLGVALPPLPTITLDAPPVVAAKEAIPAPRVLEEKVIEITLPNVPMPAKPVAPLPELTVAPVRVAQEIPALPIPSTPVAAPTLTVSRPTVVPEMVVKVEAAPAPAIVVTPAATPKPAGEFAVQAAPTPSVPPRLTTPAVPETTDVRVMVKLGAGQPRFDVYSGDDVMLKVVSDKVDVQSPTTSGETMTPMKAKGNVRFSAPGCEGTCDELTVLHATGEIELVGNIRVKCTRGKAETEFSAQRMNFRLGSAPAYSVPEPTTP